MTIYIYDFEVFAYDWLVVFKHLESGAYTIISNDHEALQDFMLDNQDAIFCGFNSKGYDRFIMTAIVAGLSQAEIKAVNDWIISGESGWSCPLLQGLSSGFFHNIDIMDDTQKGQSLKSVEGHLGMSIEESGVDFDINRKLTDAEMKETIHYCRHDVDATEKLFRLRKDYLNSKINVGNLAGIPPEQALAMTNAKLTAAFLKARAPATPWEDERKYVYPDNLKREYIPQEVFDFFDRMYDPNVSDEDLFSSKLNIDIGGTPAVVGFGGIHSALPNYMSEGGQ